MNKTQSLLSKKLKFIKDGEKYFFILNFAKKHTKPYMWLVLLVRREEITGASIRARYSEVYEYQKEYSQGGISIEKKLMAVRSTFKLNI